MRGIAQNILPCYYTHTMHAWTQTHTHTRHHTKACSIHSLLETDLGGRKEGPGISTALTVSRDEVGKALHYTNSW